jgi:hypothetical protein
MSGWQLYVVKEKQVDKAGFDSRAAPYPRFSSGWYASAWPRDRLEAARSLILLQAAAATFPRALSKAAAVVAGIPCHRRWGPLPRYP